MQVLQGSSVCDSFQLLPAEDGLVKIDAIHRSIRVMLSPVAKAKGKIFTLKVMDIVETNTIQVIPGRGETIQGKTGYYAGLNVKGKVVNKDQGRWCCREFYSPL